MCASSGRSPHRATASANAFECFLRSAEKNVRRAESAAGAQEPAAARALLGGVDVLRVAQHAVDSVGGDGATDNRER